MTVKLDLQKKYIISFSGTSLRIRLILFHRASLILFIYFLYASDVEGRSFLLHSKDIGNQFNYQKAVVDDINIFVNASIEQVDIYPGVLIYYAQASCKLFKTRMLSFAGRLTFSKSILATIPAYAMSLAYIPTVIYDDLDELCRIFVYDSTNGSKTLHIVGWITLSQPKAFGGLAYVK
ncbi:putative ribonuclease H protein, partial [Mucuna pruriens]